MVKYEKPEIVEQDAKAFVENEAWFFIPAWAVAALGGAWAWCNLVCGWGNISSCETGWIHIKATCK